MTSRVDPSPSGLRPAVGGLSPSLDLLDLLPAAVVLLQGEHVAFVNRAFETMIGYGRNRLQEPGFLFSLMNPGDRATVRANESDRLAGQPAPERYEIRLALADGSERWHELAASVLHIGDQETTALIVRDSSTERAAAAAIAAGEERFRAVIDTVTIGLILWDGVSPGMVNAEVERITGYSQEELRRPGMLASIIHPDDLALVRSRTLDAGKTANAPQRYPVRFYRRDGELRWVEMGAFNLVMDTGHRSLVALRDITDQKRSEDALRDSESRFRALVDTVPVGIFLWDGADVLFANRALEQITGYSRSQILERGFLHGAWHPDDRHYLHARGVARLQGEFVPATVEARFIRAGGEVRWLEMTARLVGQGGELQTLVAVRDITEARDASEALRESETRFATIFRESPYAMSLAAVAGGTYVDVNDAFLGASGLTRGEVVGVPIEKLPMWTRYTEAAGDDSWHAAIQRDGRAGPFEGQWFAADGRVLDCIYHLRNIRLGGEEYVLGTFLDITERRQAERALERSEERWRKAFRGSPVASCLLSLGTFAVVDVNPSCEALFGVSAADFIGRDPGQLGLSHEVPRLREALARRETIVNLPMRIARKTSPVDVLLSAEQIMLGEEPCALLMMTDITAIRRADQERREFEARIQQVQKLESLGILAGGIAHDFNNLLMGVLGNAGLALMELPPESPARQTVRDIETAAVRAAELTRQMLAYSGKGAFVVELLDLSRLVEEMAHLLRASISHRCRVEYHFEPGLPPIEGDPTQVRQVVMNLITNAADAVGENEGVISVSSGTLRADAATLRDSYLAEELPEGDYVYLDVADSGAGMDTETVARIFDPFFTTKFTGRGLGLAAVLGIVRGHRAAIKVESTPGKGTRFRVLFPRAARAHTPAVDPQSAASAVAWRGSGLLLVVDDDDTVRAVTKLMLERSGFSVLAARDGVEGVELFRQNSPAIRAIVLDMTMPRMDGEATFDAIRTIDPAARVVLSSGYAEQDATGAFALGALAGFIQKPYSADELLVAIRAALAE